MVVLWRRSPQIYPHAVTPSGTCTGKVWKVWRCCTAKNKIVVEAVKVSEQRVSPFTSAQTPVGDPSLCHMQSLLNKSHNSVDPHICSRSLGLAGATNVCLPNWIFDDERVLWLSLTAINMSTLFSGSTSGRSVLSRFEHGGSNRTQDALIDSDPVCDVLLELAGDASLLAWEQAAISKVLMKQFHI